MTFAAFVWKKPMVRMMSSTSRTSAGGEVGGGGVALPERGGDLVHGLVGGLRRQQHGDGQPERVASVDAGRTRRRGSARSCGPRRLWRARASRLSSPVAWAFSLLRRRIRCGRVALGDRDQYSTRRRAGAGMLSQGRRRGGGWKRPGRGRRRVVVCRPGDARGSAQAKTRWRKSAGTAQGRTLRAAHGRAAYSAVPFLGR